jgi:hypothetical protein
MSPKTKRTKEYIIEEMKKRIKNNQSITASNVAQENPGLYQAARRRFGGWLVAVKTAGFKYPQQGKKWAKELVIEKIREYLDQGIEPLSTTDHTLYVASRSFYESWSKAVKAAKSRRTYKK